MNQAAGAGVAAGLLTLVVLRVVLIHASLSEIINWEEPYRLAIAKAVLEGSRWSLTDYQADAYQGGSLAVGILAAPLVAVLGPSYETLKLVPLGFTFLTALAWALLLWRWVSPRAAVVAAWAFALAPPMAQIYQVHAMGSHAESALFTVVGFWLTLALMDPAIAAPRARALAFGLGAVAGLGLWYCYSAASGILAWALVGVATTPVGRVRRVLLPLLAGGIVGFAPWLVYNVRTGFSGVERVVELFGPRSADLAPQAEPLAVRAAALVGVDLVRALGFAETVSGLPEWPAWTAYVVAIACCAVLAILALRVGDARHPQPIVARLIVVAITVHLAAYLVSAFRCDVENGFIAYRFFSPLFSLLAAASAIVLTGPRRGWTRGLAHGGLALVLGLGALGTAQLLRERPAQPLPLLTQADALMGQATLLKNRIDPAHGLDLIARLDEPRRTRAYFGFGWGLEFRYEKDGDLQRLVGALAAATPDGRRAVLSGVRWAVRTRERQVRRFANAGFLADYSRALHARIAELAARVTTIETTPVVAATIGG